MTRAAVIAALVGLFTIPTNAQTAPAIEVFGGYQFFHANSGAPVAGFNSFNLNGWDASVSGYFSRYVGITADVAGSYGAPQINVPQFGATGIHTRLYTYMFGPTLRAANKSPLQPFAHVLFGGAHLTGSVNIPVANVSVSDSDTGFTWAAGGGLDFKVAPFFAIRAAQFDFVQTHIGGDNENHYRFAAGAVLRF